MAARPGPGGGEGGVRAMDGRPLTASTRRRRASGLGGDHSMTPRFGLGGAMRFTVVTTLLVTGELTSKSSAALVPNTLAGCAQRSVLSYSCPAHTRRLPASLLPVPGRDGTAVVHATAGLAVWNISLASVPAAACRRYRPPQTSRGPTPALEETRTNELRRAAAPGAENRGRESAHPSTTALRD